LVKASQLDPKNAQNRIRLARCYWALGYFVGAKREALKVLEQVPDNGDAIIALTEATRSKEDIEAAEEQLRKFPKKNDVSFLLASANVFLSKGDLPAAINAVGQALALDPKSSRAHMAMGNLSVLGKNPHSRRNSKSGELAPIRSVDRDTRRFFLPMR
jgi:tetratricopeptide (TPR) repeat protein